MDGQKYLIESDNRFLNLNVPFEHLKRDALAVFTSKDKAQQYIADAGHWYGKPPEEMGRVVPVSEEQFQEVLNRRLTQGIRYFWEDPTAVEPDRVEEYMLDEMTGIREYLQESGFSNS